MTGSHFQRLFAGSFLVGTALALAGCQSGMTYGTGTPPGIQTLEDLGGIAALTTPKSAPIDYKQRPNIVAPPVDAALPAPGGVADDGVPADWPNDPDLDEAKFKGMIAARQAAGLPLPKFTLPKTAVADAATSPGVEVAGAPTAAQKAQAKKLFAEAKGTLGVDANGNPVRRYLTDPPVDYRVPDPNSTVDANGPPPQKRSKFFKWWWQQ